MLNTGGRKIVRSATLRDVAESVGVSESTVSVVLNKTRSGTRVSSATRRNVIEAACRLGYRPNSIARSLQSGRTNRIGFYSGWMNLDNTNQFLADLLGGIFEACTPHGLNVVIHTSGSDESKLLDLVSSQAVDGLLIRASVQDPIVPIIDQLRIPGVLLVDHFEGMPAVCVDDETGGILQAQHLGSLGHRHVLYMLASHATQSMNDRYQSFVRAASDLGIEVTVHEGRWDRDMLDEKDFRVLCAHEHRATAFVGSTDLFAVRALRSLEKLGVRVPEDVAVLGFDGIFDPSLNLTTIRAPWAQVGRLGVSQLVRLLGQEEIPQVTRIPVEFMRGKTT